jgi:hypothetical protein
LTNKDEDVFEVKRALCVAVLKAGKQRIFSRIFFSEVNASLVVHLLPPTFPFCILFKIEID